MKSVSVEAQKTFSIPFFFFALDFHSPLPHHSHRSLGVRSPGVDIQISSQLSQILGRPLKGGELISGMENLIEKTNVVPVQVRVLL